MNKKDALVVQILAQKSLRDNAKTRVTAPESLYDAVRSQFEKTEKDLEGTKVTVSVHGGRGTQKALTWHPGFGLSVHDQGPSGFPHWKDVPSGVLLTTVTLIPELMELAQQIRTKNKSKDLETGAKAVLDGADLPLVPAPAPIVRPVGPEDSPVDKVVVDDEDEDDSIYEDEEGHDEEEEDVEEDSSDSLEILGTPSMPEIDDSPQVNLEDLLPPAAVAVDVEAKKPRRGRKK
jgi:hypothetical protein